jgi:hypothetical protein
MSLLHACQHTTEPNTFWFECDRQAWAHASSSFHACAVHTGHGTHMLVPRAWFTSRVNSAFLRSNKLYLELRLVQFLATDWTTGRSRFDPRQRKEIFSSSLCVQTGSGAHPASCTMGTGVLSPGAKARSGRDADHSLPSSADVVTE